MKIVVNPKIFSKRVDGRWILLENNKEYLRELNEVAGCVWEMVQTPVTVKKIVERVCKEFAVEREVAKKDITSMINRYLDEGFLIESN